MLYISEVQILVSCVCIILDYNINSLKRIWLEISTLKLCSINVYINTNIKMIYRNIKYIYSIFWFKMTEGPPECNIQTTLESIDFHCMDKKTSKYILCFT